MIRAGIIVAAVVSGMLLLFAAGKAPGLAAEEIGLCRICSP